MGGEDEFIETFLEDEEKISKYKERKQYRTYATRGILLSILVAVLLLWAEGNLLKEYSIGVAFDVLAVVFVGSFVLSLTADYYQSKSDLSEEIVAYHELANARKRCRGEAFEEASEHLVACKQFLQNCNADRISDNVTFSLIAYLNAIEEAKDPAGATEQTFDGVYPVVTEHILREEEKTIEYGIKDIEKDSAPSIDGLHRAKSDIQGLIRHGVFGFWGVVVSSFVVGYSVFNFYSKVLGAGLIGAILTVYGLHQRREN